MQTHLRVNVYLDLHVPPIQKTSEKSANKTFASLAPAPLSTHRVRSRPPLHKSAACRFAKQYDCMDVHQVFEPNASSAGERGQQSRSDSAAGSTFGSTNGGSSTRDMVASLGDVKPSIRQFDGKSEYL